VLRRGKIGEAILAREGGGDAAAPQPPALVVASSPRPQTPRKHCPPDKILNPRTGICVLRRGKIGQHILAAQASDAPARPPVRTTKPDVGGAESALSVAERWPQSRTTVNPLVKPAKFKYAHKNVDELVIDILRDQQKRIADGRIQIVRKKKFPEGMDSRCLYYPDPTRRNTFLPLSDKSDASKQLLMRLQKKVRASDSLVQTLDEIMPQVSLSTKKSMAASDDLKFLFNAKALYYVAGVFSPDTHCIAKDAALLYMHYDKVAPPPLEEMTKKGKDSLAAARWFERKTMEFISAPSYRDALQRLRDGVGSCKRKTYVIPVSLKMSGYMKQGSGHRVSLLLWPKERRYMIYDSNGYATGYTEGMFTVVENFVHVTLGLSNYKMMAGPSCPTPSQSVSKTLKNGLCVLHNTMFLLFFVLYNGKRSVDEIERELSFMYGRGARHHLDAARDLQFDFMMRFYALLLLMLRPCA
jgi:hypothetical protein